VSDQRRRLSLLRTGEEEAAVADLRRHLGSAAQSVTERFVERGDGA
jgi:hypothetical protein